MSTMTEKMGQAGSGRAPLKNGNTGNNPKKGDHFRCAECGMAIEVTADCRCSDADHVHFHCCGKELEKA